MASSILVCWYDFYVNPDLLSFVDIESPSVSQNWVKSSQEERIALVSKVASRFIIENKAEVVEAHASGEVYLTFSETPAVSERGKILLDLESELKRMVDQGITVWLKPMGDRSALRKLRGVNIKSMRKID